MLKTLKVRHYINYSFVRSICKNIDLVSLSHRSLIAPQMKPTGLMLLWIIKMASDNASNDCIPTTLFYPHDSHTIIVHDALQTRTSTLLLSSEILLLATM